MIGVLQQATDSIARAAVNAQLRQIHDSIANHLAYHADSVYVRQAERALNRSALDAQWMGVYVGALGGLFAVGAIVAGFWLFRQSRDYERKLNASLESVGAAERSINEYKALLDGFIREKTAELQTKVEMLVAESKTATGQAKDTIEAEIDRLKTAQSTLAAAVPTLTYAAAAPTASFFGTGISAEQSIFASQLLVQLSVQREWLRSLGLSLLSVEPHPEGFVVVVRSADGRTHHHNFEWPKGWLGTERVNTATIDAVTKYLMRMHPRGA